MLPVSNGERLDRGEGAVTGMARFGCRCLQVERKVIPAFAKTPVFQPVCLRPEAILTDDGFEQTRCGSRKTVLTGMRIRISLCI